MIDLQSHSTVSDGQLEPADVVRSAAEAGVTVMSLTDHDGVAGVEEANARRRRARDRERARASRCRASTSYSEDLHICGYWVDLEKIAPACDKAQQERVDRAKEIIANLNAHGVEVTFEGAVGQGRAPPTRSAARTSPRPPAPGPTSARSSRSTWCPGRRRSSRASGRPPSRRSRSSTTPAASPSSPTPTGTSQDPSRSATWSRAWSATSASTGSRPSIRRTPPSRPSTASSSARSSAWSPTASSDFHGPTHKTFSRWGAYDTYGLGEPQVPAEALDGTTHLGIAGTASRVGRRLPRSSTSRRAPSAPRSAAPARSTIASLASRRPGLLLRQLGQPRGLVHRVADHRVLEAGLLADVAGDRLAGGDADRRLEALDLARQALGELARGGQAADGASSSSTGAPKTASAASPSNLFTQPPWRSTTSTTTAKKPLSSSTTSSGGRSAASAVEPITSVNRTADLAGLAAELDVALERRAGDILADVAAEQVLDALALAQPGDHRG